MILTNTLTRELDWAKDHDQSQCATCGLWTVWTNRKDGLTTRQCDCAPRHGIDCTKEIHDPNRSGYLHGSLDDTPYDVDGTLYCGRCHLWIGCEPK